MDLLVLLAENQAAVTVAAAAHLQDAVHAATGSVPAVFGLCAAAGIAAAGAVVRALRPAPEAGQVWVARRRDIRGIRVRITGAGAWPTAVVLTPPPGPLADQVVGAPIHLTIRGRRLPGFHLDSDRPPLPQRTGTTAMTITDTPEAVARRG